jgi:hypothetical protein
MLHKKKINFMHYLNIYESKSKLQLFSLGLRVCN